MKLDRAFGLFTLASATALIAAAGCSVQVEELDDGSGVGGSGGGSSSSVTATSGTVQPQTTATGTGTSTGTGTGGGAPADESTNCADAVPLEAKMNNSGLTFYDAEAYLAEAGDSDYFKFTAKAGDWIQLFTDANPMDDTDMVDTVLTLYNEDGSTQLAEVDDAFPRQTTDSELIYQVVADGTYCLKVWEFSDWNGDTPEGGPTFKYRVGNVPIDFSVYEQYNLDTEPNNTRMAPQTGLSYALSQANQNITNFAGTFGESADVDVYEVTTPAGAKGMATTFTPSGPDGFGSTRGPGHIRVYDDNNTMIAYLDYSKGADGFSSIPVMAETKYYLEVNGGAGSGSNDSYFIKFNTSDALNPQEADDTLNNNAVGAEIAVGQVNQNNPMMNSFFLGGALGEPDTDWWKVSAKKDDVITVACSAMRAGSGIRDMTVALYASDGTTEMQKETETDAADILWSTHPTQASLTPVTATADGDYFLKLSATMLDGNNTGNWYMCGVHVTTP